MSIMKSILVLLILKIGVKDGNFMNKPFFLE